MVGGMHGFARLAKTILVGRAPTPASGSLRLAVAVAAIALAGALGEPGEAQTAGQQIFWPEQGWTPTVRRGYHHRSQGTATLPLPTSWFLAVEQPNRSRHPAGLFSDPAYLDTFGFIPSPRDETDNPHGLPVGFARTAGINPVTGDRNDPRTGQPNDWIGFTCAACHTGRIDFGTTSILVDGGPALIDLGEFGSRLGLALGETLLFEDEFDRFANRLLPTNVGRLQRLRLRARLRVELVKVVARGLGMVVQNLGSGGTAEGFGRLDALNRIGNTVFGEGMRLPENNVRITAPVAFPHLWDTPWFTWVQYNGSIQQPMVRNAGEAMGVSALVNYNHNSVPTPRFTSTIPVRSLHDDIEQLLEGAPPLPARAFSGLTSPAWPEQILGRIDRQLADTGAELYGEFCQGCHLPAPNTNAFWDSNRWVEIAPGGQRYLDLTQVPISRIGTDPAQARDMASRTVRVRADVGLPNWTGPDGNLRSYPFGPALGDLVALVTNRFYDANNVPQTERDRLNGNRPNRLRTRLEYKARPLNGIWATAPFLHNGSVPNLWDLLSPYAERNRHCDVARRADRCILLVGSRQFDPARVGYVNGGPFRLDTSIAGNLNTGHLFEGPANMMPRPPGNIGRGFSQDERRALIEYLKTL